MRIVVDMQGAQASNRDRGIGRYSLSFIEALARNALHDEIILLLNELFPESVKSISTLFLNRYSNIIIKTWRPIPSISYLENETNSLRLQFAKQLFRLTIDSLKPDVVLYTSIFEGLVDNAAVYLSVEPADYLQVSILYDLIPLINSDLYLANPAVKSWYFDKLEALKRSDLLLAISDSSCLEAIKHINRTKYNCIPIYADVDPCFNALDLSSEQESEIKKRYGINNGFILYTGGIDHRKNIEGLISAYSRLPNSIKSIYQLVVVCSVHSESRHRLEVAAQKSNLRDNQLILTGFIPDQDLVSLYTICDLFVFPSWHEGFGLPVLEAMRCGAPVICSSLSSLPEICAFNEALFDPYNIKELTGLIEKAILSTPFRQRLLDNSSRQNQRYSWDATAQLALTAIKQCDNRKEPNQSKETGVSSQRHRLAYLSPLPPERSGISWYSKDLLPALQQYYEIDVIVVDIQDAFSEGLGDAEVKTVEWFRRNHRAYDRILYHFGNSHFHSHMVNLLQDIPGVVVLHDFFLSGLYWHLESSDPVNAAFSVELYQSHGYKALYEKEVKGKNHDCISNFPCNHTVINNSLGIISHSFFSRQLYSTYYGRPADSWAVIPLLKSLNDRPCPHKSRELLGLDKNAFIVCSFGIIAPSKLSERLLSSWLQSNLSRKKDCYLIFVGANVWGEYAVELQEAIDSSDCSDRIIITGWVEADEFSRYLEVADLAVQLRSMTRGETSAAVYDCMKHMTPLVVNANGSMAELPQQAVHMLPDSFSDQLLTDILEKMYNQPDYRSSLAAEAYKIVSTENSPEHCSSLYRTAIEGFYDHHQSISTLEDIILCQGIDLIEKPVISIQEASLAISRSFRESKKGTPQLLVDITDVHQLNKHNTRFLLATKLIKALLLSQPSGWRIEPVCRSCEDKYYYARKVTMSILDSRLERKLDDELADINQGDIFMCGNIVSLTPFDVQDISLDPSIRELRRLGVMVISDLASIISPRHSLQLLHQPTDFDNVGDQLIDAYVLSFSELIIQWLASISIEPSDRERVCMGH